jgi:hypothetical protein
MARWLVVFSSLLGLLGAGCMDMLAKDDGQAFGDDLGRFAVGARLKSSTCGVQALETPESWDFEVVLSRDGDLVYWNTGDDAVEGSLDADGKTFSFSSETVVQVDSSSHPRACSVVRRDSASGTFDDAEDVRAFDGSLSYRFTPKAGTDCTDLVASASFDELPCVMNYRMAAAWVSNR